MGKLYKPDGMSKEVKPVNGKSFTLEELYDLLDCRVVERFHLPDGRQVWMDEEGKLADKEPNELASKLLGLSGGIEGDYVVGNALILNSTEAGDGEEDED